MCEPCQVCGFVLVYTVGAPTHDLITSRELSLRQSHSVKLVGNTNYCEGAIQDFRQGQYRCLLIRARHCFKPRTNDKSGFQLKRMYTNPIICPLSQSRVPKFPGNTLLIPPDNPKQSCIKLACKPLLLRGHLMTFTIVWIVALMPQATHHMKLRLLVLPQLNSDTRHLQLDLNHHQQPSPTHTYTNFKKPKI